MAMRDYNFYLVAGVVQSQEVYGDFYGVITSELPFEISFDDGVWLSREQAMGGTQDYKRVSVRSNVDQEVVVSLGEGTLYDGRSVTPPYTVVQNRLVQEATNTSTTILGGAVEPISPTFVTPYPDKESVKGILVQISLTAPSNMLPVLLRTEELMIGDGIELMRGDSVFIEDFRRAGNTYMMWIENPNVFDVKINTMTQSYVGSDGS